MPNAKAEIPARNRANNRLSPALALITLANSNGKPVALKTATIRPTVPIAINKRPNVIPPPANALANKIGR